MKKLNVLFACPLIRNPYIFQAIESILLDARIEQVQYGVAWLWDVEQYGKIFDIIHIHWPEALVDWRSPTEYDLFKLETTLNRWKQTDVKIICTVHNMLPHTDQGSTTLKKRLYEIVYSAVDALIHLGKRSVPAIKSMNLPFLFEGKVMHEIIPHGNYDYFIKTAKIIDSEKKVKKYPRPTVLVFGSIRNHNELKLIKKVAIRANKFKFDLIVASQLPSPWKYNIRYYLNRYLFWLLSNTTLIEGRIDDSLVKSLFEKIDVLFIPRVNSELNSGNVALGYTFGKVVVGPSSGVIGEDLAALNNPTFDHTSEKSVYKALDKAISMSKQGEINGKHAAINLNWQKIGGLHVDLYEKLVRINHQFRPNHM